MSTGFRRQIAGELEGGRLDLRVQGEREKIMVAFFCHMGNYDGHYFVPSLCLKLEN
jgi:hypothetical protein